MRLPATANRRGSTSTVKPRITVGCWCCQGGRSPLNSFRRSARIHVSLSAKSRCIDDRNPMSQALGNLQRDCDHHLATNACHKTSTKPTIINRMQPASTMSANSPPVRVWRSRCVSFIRFHAREHVHICASARLTTASGGQRCSQAPFISLRMCFEAKEM